MDEVGRAIAERPASRTRRGAVLLCALGVAVYAFLQLGSLGHPLFWQDEGETAMFGRRILEHGEPRVHGAEGVVFGMGIPLERAVDAERDVYRGSLWGQYYLAALGVAWSDRVEDVHARTRRVRLPFVAFGLVGLLALVLAHRPALAARCGSAWPGAAAFAWLLCIATSLQLHLREARYYGPAVGGVGLAVWLDARAARSDGARRARWLPVAQLVVLVALVTTFFPAAVAVMAWIGLECGLAVRRHRASQPGLPAGLVARLAPVGVAGVVGVALALEFDVLSVSRALSERWQFGADLYARNLGHVLVWALRWELLGPVLVLEGLLAWTRRDAPADEPARRAAAALLRLAGLYALVGARNPIFFERYFVPLGPVLALVAVLDGEALLGRLGGRDSPRAGHRRRVAAAALALALLATLGVRHRELAGRVREIVTPVAGPIDFLVADLRARHADPAGLLIATNYEAEPLMFYLGSRVVGRFHSARPEVVAAERAERPDVVVPRVLHPDHVADVRRYLLAGGYARRTLPVADTPYNTIPELYGGRVLTRTHWFATPEPGPGSPPLVVYERVSPGSVEE